MEDVGKLRVGGRLEVFALRATQQMINVIVIGHLVLRPGEYIQRILCAAS